MPDLLSSITSLPLPVTILAILWLLIMVAVPIIKALWGKDAEKWGIQMGVLAQVITVLALLWTLSGPLPTLITALGVPILGWAAEFLGSKTGFPFGPYHYTQRLQPQLGGVPLLIPLAWLMMMAPSWAVGASLTNILGLSAQPVVVALFSAAAMTAWDLFLDTQMVAWDFWQWHKKGRYFGIPLENFAGWFAVSFLISLVLPVDLGSAALGPLIIIYGLTWVLEFIAQFFFWNLRGSALVGLVVMGALAVPALLRL